MAAPETEKAKEFKKFLSAGNDTATVFLDCGEVIVVDAIPRRETVTTDA
jgi:hypothetical protein